MESVLTDSRKRGPCALAALALVVVLFPDILFLGGSLAPLDYDLTLSRGVPEASVSVYPEASGRKTVDGWGDIGAAAWQFEPTVRLMARAMRTGESVWWNPYDAAGRMGPESMVDVHFSPVTLVAAAFGGGGTSLTFTLLGLYSLAAYCLIRALHRYLGVSFLAACTAAALFLLSGFALGNLNSQMGQPYFFAPLVLLSLLALAEERTTWRLALCALAHAVLFLVTFFPTMVLVLLSVHAIVLAFSARQRFILLQATAPLLAALLVGFLYLPILEANLKYVDTVSSYNARLTPGYSLESALSLFTPKHFWQSYRGMSAEPQWPPVVQERWVFHIGIIASLLAASGTAWFKRREWTWVACACAALVAIAVGQMFGIPPFTLFDKLPFFSFVRNEYWPALAGVPIVVLVGMGIDNLAEKASGKGADVAVMSVGAAIAASLGYLLVKLRVPLLQPARGAVWVAVILFVFALVACLLCLLRVSFAKQLRLALAIGACGEGLYYMNNLHAARNHREEQLPDAIGWVKQHVPGPAGNRVLNIGWSGIMPDWGGAIGVPEMGAIEMSILTPYRNFYNSRMGEGLFLSLFGGESQFLFTRDSLSMAGVRYVLVDRTFQSAIDRLEGLGLKQVHTDSVRIVYENPGAMPRAFFAGGAGTVKIEEYANTRVRLHAANAAAGTLVLMDSWHPNWTAHVDGTEVPVQLVNTAFRGVALQSGSHEVEFRYRPKTLTAGICLSSTGVFGTLLLFLRKRHIF